MCDAAGLKSSLKTTDKSRISGWRFEIAPSGAVVAAGATYQLGAGNRAGPNRDARVAAPQEMTKGRESWLNTAQIFLLPYPLGQLGTGGKGNDQDPG
jgi:hypothetical protein